MILETFLLTALHNCATIVNQNHYVTHSKLNTNYQHASPLAEVWKEEWIFRVTTLNCWIAGASVTNTGKLHCVSVIGGGGQSAKCRKTALEEKVLYMPLLTTQHQRDCKVNTSNPTVELYNICLLYQLVDIKLTFVEVKNLVSGCAFHLCWLCNLKTNSKTLWQWWWSLQMLFTRLKKQYTFCSSLFKMQDFRGLLNVMTNKIQTKKKVKSVGTFLLC